MAVLASLRTLFLKVLVFLRIPSFAYTIRQKMADYYFPLKDENLIREYFMRQALEMGELALSIDEVPVGCVFVLDNKVIAKGMNDTNRSLSGHRHAEFAGIETVLCKYPASVFKKVDLYVTVEPCIMCASALRQLRIRAVYFGCSNDRFGGCGGVLHINLDAGIDRCYPAIGGIFREEAIMLLRRFYLQENDKAPNPTAKRNRILNTIVDNMSIDNTRSDALLEAEFSETACEPLKLASATSMAVY
ncbi:tRNA(adenine34) deaminase [Orbilia blumenaviensis]|uniref:tRNA(adenine(34)) deaminase n=1 Tax=Orbilia blumenaviensis TaxID=1796055 RepID=A0AAV9V7Q4_9PEZI